MDAMLELEKLKSEFVKLNTDSEIQEFKNKISARWNMKTELEKSETYNAFVKSFNKAIKQVDKVCNYVNSQMSQLQTN